MSILDLGSGTGRLSPALAEAFGGPRLWGGTVGTDARGRHPGGGPPQGAVPGGPGGAHPALGWQLWGGGCTNSIQAVTSTFVSA